MDGCRLLIERLTECSVVYDFRTTVDAEDDEARRLKTAYLRDLVDYLGNASAPPPYSVDIYNAAIQMVGSID